MIHEIGEGLSGSGDPGHDRVDKAGHFIGEGLHVEHPPDLFHDLEEEEVGSFSCDQT